MIHVIRRIYARHPENSILPGLICLEVQHIDVLLCGIRLQQAPVKIHQQPEPLLIVVVPENS